MRRFILAVLLLSTIMFAGCTEKDKDVLIGPDLILGETVIYGDTIINEEDGDVPQPPSILLISGDQVRILCGRDKNPSQPCISPNRKKLAYISPFEFETIGEVHIYDASNRLDENAVTSTDIPDEYSPKKLFWLDDRYLLAIVGYAYGTVSRGGDLYVYDTIDKRLSFLISENDDKRQITDITADNEDITLDITVYDDDMSDYSTEKRIMTYQDIMDRIK